jgi:hypothetical protein
MQQGGLQQLKQHQALLRGKAEQVHRGLCNWIEAGNFWAYPVLNVDRCELHTLLLVLAKLAAGQSL